MNTFEKKQLHDWANDVHKGCADKMKSSAIYAGVISKGFMDDPVCALQLGLALLYDKPIILLVDKDLHIPEKLLKIASVVERVDIGKSEDMARASEAIRTFIDKMEAH